MPIKYNIPGYLGIHSKSGPSLVSNKLCYKLYEFSRVECTRYFKPRIYNLRVKSEEQANPRSRIVHRVSYVSPTKCVWRMSQLCLHLVSPWCTEVVGHQLTQFHMHSAKSHPYTEIPNNRRNTPSQSCSVFISPKVGHAIMSRGPTHKVKT